MNKTNEGEVIAVGKGITTRDGSLIVPEVQVGDKVLLPEYGGIQLKSEGDEIFMYSSSEIVAKIC